MLEWNDGGSICPFTGYECSQMPSTMYMLGEDLGVIPFWLGAKPMALYPFPQSVSNTATEIWQIGQHLMEVAQWWTHLPIHSIMKMLSCTLL